MCHGVAAGEWKGEVAMRRFPHRLLLLRFYYDSPEKIGPSDGTPSKLAGFCDILQTLLELFHRILVPLTPGSWN
jgi:hypothetical protein